MSRDMHRWSVVRVEFQRWGAVAESRCVWCGATRWYAPGEKYAEYRAHGRRTIVQRAPRCEARAT